MRNVGVPSPCYLWRSGEEIILAFERAILAAHSNGQGLLQVQISLPHRPRTGFLTVSSSVRNFYDQNIPCGYLQVLCLLGLPGSHLFIYNFPFWT